MCVFSLGSLKCHQLDNLVSWMGYDTNFDILSFINLDRLRSTCLFLQFINS